MYSVLLFLTFFPTGPVPDLAASLPSLTSLKHDEPPKRRDAILVGTLILLTLFGVGLTSIAIVAVYPHHTQSWANTLGVVAGTLSAVQYIPQIYFTFRLKDVKSLSIATMIIQVPGAFLFAFSLFLRVGWNGWSTWLVYVITGVLQGILLALGISYWMAARKETELEENLDSEPEEEVADERTALVSKNRSATRPIQASQGSQRSLGLLYAATPPEHDSD